MNPRERFAYQRRKDLFALVNNGHSLPIGAKELVKEAIEEHDQAFDPDFLVESGIEGMDTEFIIEIPHGNPDGDVIGGTIQRLGVRFKAKKLSQRIVPAFFLPVVVQFESSPQTPIYPDKLRFVGVDRDGNSNPVVFMFAISESLSGQIATITVNAYDVHQSSLNFLVK